MIVTINTDASYSKTHKVGAFAFWIVCNEFKILKSGVLKKEIASPTIAEIMCIVNAVHILMNQDCQKVSKIIINTDSLNAVHLFNQDKAMIKRWGLNKLIGYYALYRKILNEANFEYSKIELRHVKAHETTVGARNWVNDWCDRNAKAQLLKILNKTK